MILNVILMCLTFSSALAIGARADATSRFGRNLIQNGDAEGGPPSPTGTTPVSIPGWATTGVTVVPYGAPGGFPTGSDPGPVNRDSQFFAGGHDIPRSTATQSIDVSPEASSIDTGSVLFALSGFLGGFATQRDNATLTAEFVDAYGRALGDVTIGPVTAGDRGNVTGLVERTADGAVPVGTRSINVVLTMTRLDFVYNDGYADNLSLELADPGGPALGDVHLYVGLRNSDDQGTRVDIQVELLQNGAAVASGLKRCVNGVTRNPSLAKEVIVQWDAFSPVLLSPGDVLSLRVSARIGTNADDTKCSPGPGASHASAVGVRLYYDSIERPSRVDAEIAPDLGPHLYLDSDGKACGGAGPQSAGVTARSLSTTSPVAANPKCLDSSTLKFSGGNRFALVGTWSLAPLP